MESLLKDRETITSAVEPGFVSNKKSGFKSLHDFLTAPNGSSGGVTDTRPDPASCSSEPQIEVVEEEGEVKRFIVTCKCGDRIEIECSYSK